MNFDEIKENDPIIVSSKKQDDKTSPPFVVRVIKIMKTHTHAGSFVIRKNGDAKVRGCGDIWTHKARIQKDEDEISKIELAYKEWSSLSFEEREIG